MAAFRNRQVVLALLVAIHATPQAQEAPRPQLALDCWITSEDAYAPVYFIACIEDRQELAPADDALDAPQIVALDTIHRLLHQGPLPELDLYVRQSATVLQPGDIRKIRIFSYPSQLSWDEGRPQILVRNLCPEGYDCPIFIRRTIQPPAPAQ